MNEPMHRFKYTKLTKEQIGQKLKSTAAGPKSESKFSDVLAEKTLKIVTDDGPVLNYAIGSKSKLMFAEKDGPMTECLTRVPPAHGFLFPHDPRN
jgi:hypothetical protein